MARRAPFLPGFRTCPRISPGAAARGADANSTCPDSLGGSERVRVGGCGGGGKSDPLQLASRTKISSTYRRSNSDAPSDRIPPADDIEREKPDQAGRKGERVGGGGKECRRLGSAPRITSTMPEPRLRDSISWTGSSAIGTPYTREATTAEMALAAKLDGTIDLDCVAQQSTTLPKMSFSTVRMRVISTADTENATEQASNMIAVTRLVATSPDATFTPSTVAELPYVCVVHAPEDGQTATPEME